jgi:hypothetical protein
MYKIKKKSAWGVDGSVVTSLGVLAVSGGMGTLNLKNPGSVKVDFPYGYGGGGASWGVKYNPKDKFGSDDFGFALPIDLPNAGAIHILDSFTGDELTDKDISGVCFIGEFSIGAVAMSLSATGMLIGVPAKSLPKELGLLSLHQSVNHILIDILARKIKQLRSSAKAVLWMSGINAGLSLSVGLTASIGYIGGGVHKNT